MLENPVLEDDIEVGDGQSHEVREVAGSEDEMSRHVETAGVTETPMVETGKEGDLVLLDANPLIDIGNARRIHGVMLRGRWLAREDLGDTLTKRKGKGIRGPGRLGPNKKQRTR